MSRRDHTKIDQSKIVLVMTEAGLECKANGGWLKFHPRGLGIKRSLGVPTTKRVTRVELVGFESAEAGVVAHPKPPASTVTQMVDFAADEKQVLATLYRLAKSLAALAEQPAPAPEAAPAAEQAAA